MYLDVVEHKGEIHAWERDSNGVLSHVVLNSSDYTYLFMKDNTGNATHVDIFGNPMKKVSFPNKTELNKFAKDREGIVAESDVRPVYRYLIDHHIDADTSTPYNLSFFDIEVDFDLEDGNGYPTPKNPFGEINSISVYDVSLKCYVMFIPEHNRPLINLTDTWDGYDVEIVWTRNERDMLKQFSEYLEHVDIIAGWNSAVFDIPYIVARATILFGSNNAKTMFTRNGIPAKCREFVNEYKEEVWEWTLPGRIHFDMMQLFKKFHPGEHKSFSLDAICEEVLEVKKIQYEDDLGSLYRENPQRFFEYSLHDSRLLLMLDNKQQVINLAMVMVRSMCGLPKDVTGSVNIIEMALMKFCRKKNNIVLPDKPSAERQDFPGAIVYDTIAGRHGWIFTSDLTALYPSAIIALGLSVETFVAQCANGYDDYLKVMTGTMDKITIELLNGDQLEVVASDLLNEIRSSGFTISGNGTIFDGTLGLLAEFTEEGFNQRAHYKNLMKAATDPDEESRYNLYQQVFKIRNNSIYGILSQPSFRMYDVRLAASTTLTGRLISLWQAYKANDLVNKLKE